MLNIVYYNRAVAKRDSGLLFGLRINCDKYRWCNRIFPKKANSFGCRFSLFVKGITARLTEILGYAFFYALCARYSREMTACLAICHRADAGVDI